MKPKQQPSPFDLSEELRTVLAWESKCLSIGSDAVLRQVIAALDAAPEAIMDTRTELGLCAPTEADFPALYALRGRRVKLLALPEHDFDAMTAKGRAAWSDVPDATQWVEEQRGGETP